MIYNITTNTNSKHLCAEIAGATTPQTVQHAHKNYYLNLYELTNKGHLCERMRVHCSRLITHNSCCLSGSCELRHTTPILRYVLPQQAQTHVQGSSHAPCEEELTDGHYYIKRGVGKNTVVASIHNIYYD